MDKANIKESKLNNNTEQKEADRLQPEKKFNRYPGLYSFGTDAVHQRLFFGRDQEIRDLVQRLRAHRLLVLYGISGLGKTSLLQAGVFPRLEEFDMLPIRVRFQDTRLSPMQTLVQGIETEIGGMPDIDMFHKPTKTWWEFFKTTAFWRGDRVLTPVLILDQFEEIFTSQNYDGRTAIAEQLSHLVNGSVPPEVMTDIRSGKLRYREDPPELRVVLSLRIEYVGQLQELFPQIPSILNRRFILTPLGRKQARDAIVEPAALPGAEFITHPFHYQTKKLEALLDYLADKDSGTVEPYQLQLQCQEIERKVVIRQAKTDESVEVDDSLFGAGEALDSVVRDFYLRTTRELGQEVKKRQMADGHFRLLAQRRAKRAHKSTRELCEFGLLSDRGHRMPLPQAQILKQYNLNEEDLEFLVTRRLLRRERKLKSFTYELSHDSLAKPVLDSRPYRMSQKARKAARIIAVVALTIIAVLATFSWITAKKKIAATQQALEEQRVNAATAKAAEKRIRELDRANKQLLKDLEEAQGDIRQILDKNQKISQTLDEARQLIGNEDRLREKIDTAQQQTRLSQKLLSDANQKSAIDTSLIASRVPEPEMVTVEPGCYQMGSSAKDPDARKSEIPLHQVCFEERYMMGKYEVTFKEYDVFAVETGRKLPDDTGWGRGDRPVINVSWIDANAYIEWLNSKVKGKGFRLLTEAEWEYAARAGTETAFSFGDDSNKLNEYAWYEGNSERKTHPVGQKKPNPWGLHDMHGNVWEWVEDDWHDNYEGAPNDGRAWINEPRGAGRVVRGGSWGDFAHYCRSADRINRWLDYRFNFVGFRLSRSVTLGP